MESRISRSKAASGQAATIGDARQPAPSPNDERDIRQLIRDYERAYEALDLVAVMRFRPAIAESSIAAVRQSFENARSIEYKAEQCRIKLDGLTATALCVENQNYRPKKGRKEQSTRALNIQLRKESSGWVIESM